MRSTTRLIGAVLLATTSAHAAAAPGESWKVTQRSGDAHVMRTGLQSIALQANAQLLPGDVVVTGPAGRATLTRGSDYIVVAPGSRLQVPQVEQVSGFTHIVQQAGTLLYKIRHMAVPHFQVETPMLAAVIKGTTFSITVDKQRSAIQVIDGAVEVSALDGGMHRLVTNGDTVFVAHSNPKSLVLANVASIKASAEQSAASVKVAASEAESLSIMSAASGGLMRVDPVPMQAMRAEGEKPIQLAAIETRSNAPTIKNAMPVVRAEPANVPVATPVPTGALVPAAAPAPAPTGMILPAVVAILSPVQSSAPVTAPISNVPNFPSPAATLTVSVTPPSIQLGGPSSPDIVLTVPVAVTPIVTPLVPTVPVVVTPVVTTPVVSPPVATLPVITVPVGSIPQITVPGIIVVTFDDDGKGKIKLPKFPKGKSD